MNLWTFFVCFSFSLGTMKYDFVIHSHEWVGFVLAVFLPLVFMCALVELSGSSMLHMICHAWHRWREYGCFISCVNICLTSWFIDVECQSMLLDDIPYLPRTPWDSLFSCKSQWVNILTCILHVKARIHHKGPVELFWQYVAGLFHPLICMHWIFIPDFTLVLWILE